MRLYTFTVEWLNKGVGYGLKNFGCVKATSMATAAAKAIKEVKRRQGRRWREPMGADVRVTIEVGDKIESKKEE